MPTWVHTGRCRISLRLATVARSESAGPPVRRRRESVDGSGDVFDERMSMPHSRVEAIDRGPPQENLQRHPLRRLASAAAFIRPIAVMPA
jgi:hypothetical protein